MPEYREIITLVLKILFIVFFFGFCIFIHEFGHLIVAIWRGLHVEKFSIGFGRPIYRWSRNNIDYMISWLPFGGYVALPQLDPSDEPKTSDGDPLPPVEPIDRVLTAIAGPMANIVFGFILATVIWIVGIEGPAPAKSFVIGDIPQTYLDSTTSERPTPEYEAGLRAGDIVVAVNGETFTKGWQEALEMIVYSSEGIVRLSIVRGGKPMTISYALVPNPEFEGLGYPFWSPLLPTRIGGVVEDSPAWKAGLSEGDLLLEINGETVINPELLIKRIQQAGSNPITLKVKRGNRDIISPDIRAQLSEIDGRKRYLIGIQIETVPGSRVLYYPTPWQQFTDVIKRTYKTLRGLFDEKNPIKARHMSGPVGIFHILYVIVSNAGFIAALNLVILINFSLAILNLLPLPVLDGGHITLGIIEFTLGHRIPTKITLYLSYTFVVLLLSFMMYVTYYDARRVGKSMYPSTKPDKSIAPD